MRSVGLTEAKATLEGLVDDAISGRPSIITRRGNKLAVVLSIAEYDVLLKYSNRAEGLSAAPADTA